MTTHNPLVLDGLNLADERIRAKATPGNFFTYINHAEEIFGEDELIYRDLKNHIPKIRRALKRASK